MEQHAVLADFPVFAPAESRREQSKPPRLENRQTLTPANQNFSPAAIWRVADPIGNAEGAELGEITVVENENEMCRFIPEAFEHVSVATRKIPNVARIKVVRLRLPGRIDHSGAHTSFQDERPFRSGRMPVQLAHHAGFKLHRYARDSFRDRQLLDSYSFAKTVPENFSSGFLQLEPKTGQFFSG